MQTPRPYLSFSQLTTFEMSPEKYADQYLYGKKQRISRNMSYGSQMADGLEKEEATGDPILDLMMSRIPKFDIMDKPVESRDGVRTLFDRDKKYYHLPVLLNGKDHIPIMAVPDTAKKDYSAFKEYKTSVRRWSQKMADDSGQITFYATAIWLATGKIPTDIELVNVPVDYAEDGTLAPTGELIRHKTERDMASIIKMTKRMRDTWGGIKKLCESELL